MTSFCLTRYRNSRIPNFTWAGSHLFFKVAALKIIKKCLRKYDTYDAWKYYIHHTYIHSPMYISITDVYVYVYVYYRWLCNTGLFNKFHFHFPFKLWLSQVLIAILSGVGEFKEKVGSSDSILSWLHVLQIC